MFWCRHFIFLKGMHFSSTCIIAICWPYGRTFISNSPSKPTAFELEWVVKHLFLTLNQPCIQYVGVPFNLKPKANEEGRRDIKCFCQWGKGPHWSFRLEHKWWKHMQKVKSILYFVLHYPYLTCKKIYIYSHLLVEDFKETDFRYSLYFMNIIRN